MGLFIVNNNVIPSNLINDKFFIPITSVLDTKQGYWQNRKRKWLSLGIQSELGRKDNLTFGLGSFNYEDEKKRLNGDNNIKSQQTSIFDPVLCELVYKWFSRNKDKIIDPFAGGSVRGIVASVLGRNYTGIDLSEEQIEANKRQYIEISNKYLSNNIIEPNWINGDSLNCKEIAKGKYNMIFTCPPYYDLEVYSDKENDLSNLSSYKEFIDIYGNILTNACIMLEDNSFATVVVGNIRNHTDKAYYNFVGDTIQIFKDNGFLFYNDLILVNVVGTLPVRVPVMFQNSRKVGKQHQNVLVFYKGDPELIEYKFGKYEE